MMRLSHHTTVTGGTTHGRYTVHRPPVPPDGVPGFHQPDARRVSAARLALRDRVPHPYGRLADGWETTHHAPVYCLQNCPLPTPEDRLLFILAYLKTYALQMVHGRLFGMIQGKANQWIHVLLPALLAALRALGDAPARSLSGYVRDTREKVSQA